MKNRKYTYTEAIIFYLLVNFFAGFLITFFVDIKGFYTTLHLPEFAPPAWIFGIAWTINNCLILFGNITTLNLPKSFERNILVKLQICSWINYLSFQWVSFGTGIPALFFWPTLSMLILTLASIFYAQKLDKKHGTHIVYTFSTLLPWLLFATYLGFEIMINN